MTLSPAARARFDAHMMAIALRMARRGLGTTAFNPSVGAVIADEATGEVIARGWTQPGGRPHAEKEALRRAGERARGKTMYVTLEPCAHTGRVPTCADAVLSSGLARVVAALPDPNPVIAGSGFTQLREAGVAVDVGLLGDEARALTLGHIRHVTEKRPFVQLKVAISADGRIAPGNGAPVWITSPEARAAGHLLRAEADVIVTGIGTVLADDPELTCRLPGLGARSPTRVVIDSKLRTPPTAKVLRSGTETSAKVWLATTTAAARSPLAAAHVASGRVSGVLACGDERVGLRELLAALDGEPIRRVLVEAGPRLSGVFLDAGVIDEIVAFVSPTKLGDRGIPALGDRPLSLILDDRTTWTLADRRRIGADEMRLYRRT